MKKLTPKQYTKERGLKEAHNHGDFDNISPNQARDILHAKKVNGKPLTDEQFKLFGFLSKGNTRKYDEGGLIAKSGIHIKKENEGKFTEYKKRTGKTTEEALHSDDPHVRKMANFAKNAKKWKHEDGGNISRMGYRDDSPFRNRKSIDIDTPSGVIDMSETGIPILANGQVLEPYSGMHQMGTTKVKEIPMKKKGGKVKKYQSGKSDGTYDDYIKSMWGNGGADNIAPINPNAVHPIANPDYNPNQAPTATPSVQTISTTGMKAPTSGQKSGQKGYRGPSFSLGAGITAVEGIVNSLIGNVNDRKKPIDPLSYNPYPQGTGSQALFQDGGSINARKVTSVPEGYTAYNMKDGIPGASYFMKSTTNASKDISTLNSNATKSKRVAPRVGTASIPRRNSTRKNQSVSSINDYIYTQPNTEQVQPKPQTAFDGEPLYVGHNLGYRTQMQTRNSTDINDGGGVNTSKSLAVIHPVYPNTSTPNMDETYEVPADIYSNYFTGGSNHLRGSQDSLKTYRVNPKFNDGGKMKKSKNGGLTTFSGGNAPQVSENPFDGGMGEFQGKSHESGGIESSFNGVPFEAEGGEPYRLDREGNLEIFGDLTNPVTGNKFKKDGKILAKKEKKVGKYTDKGLDLVLGVTPSASKWDLLQFNSGSAMLKGGLAKQKELADTKEHLSLMQRLVLSTEPEQKNARNGGKIFQNGGTPWEYRKTKKENLDKKILEFVKLAESKGLTGFSGEKSGYDKRNTKSGRPSRHASNQALDMVFSDEDAYNKILNDSELSAYLYNNGLTAINEYDSSIAKDTGATMGHIHIGYDKGTPTSDKFRKDYKSLYKPSTPPPTVASSRFKPYEGANSGDAYTENPLTGNPYSFNRKVGEKAPSTPPAAYPNPKQFEFHQPTNKVEEIRNRPPWEQIIPAIPQVFDQPEHVDAQTYQPELYTPYQVSFQDRINQNSRNFNALAPTLVNNPEAQSVLAGQLYDTNNAVQAEEFRTNQAISNDITNKNVSLLNEAKVRNIQLRDTQSVREAQAVANTRDRRTQAGIQIGDILAKNSLENKTAAVYKNLYRDYKFDKDMNLQYTGPDAIEHIDSNNAGTSYPVESVVTKKVGDTTTKDTYMPYNYKPVSLLDGYQKQAKGRLTLDRIAKKLYQ